MEPIHNYIEIGASLFDSIWEIGLLHCYLGKKENARWWQYGIAVLLSFLNGQFMTEYFWGQIVINIIIMLVFMQLCMKGSIVEQLGSLLVFDAVISIVNSFAIQGMMIYYGLTMEHLVTDEKMRIQLLAITKLCLLAIIVFGYKKIREKRTISKEEKGLIFGVSMLFEGVTSVCLRLGTLIEVSSEIKNYFFILTFFLLLLGIFVFLMVGKINEKNHLEMENTMLKMEVEQQSSQIRNSQQLYENTRKIRHDMKHYFTTYLQLLLEGKTELVIQEIRQMIDTKLKPSGTVYMENRIVNAVINEKTEVCREEKIEMEVEIQGTFDWGREMDVAIILSNLLDNAIEAERQEPRKYIHLTMTNYKNRTNVILSNYISKSVMQENPDFKTTKKQKESHGIGLESVRKMVNELEGEMEITEEKQEFIVQMLF